MINEVTISTKVDKQHLYLDDNQDASKVSTESIDTGDNSTIAYIKTVERQTGLVCLGLQRRPCSDVIST